MLRPPQEQHAEGRKVLQAGLIDLQAVNEGMPQTHAKLEAGSPELKIVGSFTRHTGLALLRAKFKC